MSETSEVTASDKVAVDPEVERKEERDGLLTAARVLSKLRAGEKIHCRDRGIEIEIHTNIPFVPERVTRYFAGQSIARTQRCVSDIYELFWKHMDLCIHAFVKAEDETRRAADAGPVGDPARAAAGDRHLKDVHFREIQIARRLYQAARSTIMGTRSLMRTYDRDTNFTSTLSELIKEVSDKLIYYDQRITEVFKVPSEPQAILRFSSPTLSFLPPPASVTLVAGASPMPTLTMPSPPSLPFTRPEQFHAVSSSVDDE